MISQYYNKEFRLINAFYAAYKVKFGKSNLFVETNFFVENELFFVTLHISPPMNPPVKLVQLSETQLSLLTPEQKFDIIHSG